MVGRRQESTDIRRIMSAHRLVTLAGPPGVGKTRLALHVARTARRTFADGVWFVDLSYIRDPELVPQVVVETLKIPDSSTREARATIAAHLRTRHVLLIMDNCEHVRAEVASLVTALLEGAAGVHVLATSIQPLGVPGEAVFRVEALELPALGGVDAEQDVNGSAALELFASRARSAIGTFEVTRSNQAAVVQLCHKLEGLPLALELAAARLKVMTLDELTQRMDDRFRMLRSTSPVTAPRHQTLLAAVTWSHDLCTPAEQVLWRRASVFCGMFTLTSAEAVCSDEALPVDEVMDALLGLVDKSVVTSEEVAGRMWFRMLETIRGFGAEQLVAADESDRLRSSHCSWVAGLVQHASADWYGPRQEEWTRELRAQMPNIRAALDFCVSAPGAAQTGQQVAGSLWFQWIACGYLSEGRLWLERTLAAGPVTTPQRALALGSVSLVALVQGDLERAEVGTAECELAAASVAEAWLRGYAAHVRALLEFLVNPGEEAEALYDAARDIYVEANAPTGLQIVLRLQLAVLHTVRGELPAAAVLFQELERAAERDGDQWTRSYGLWGRGLLHLVDGDLVQAQELLTRSIAMKRPFNDVMGLALALDTLAWVLADTGDFTRSTRILGAASTLWTRVGPPLFALDFFTSRRSRCEERDQGSLGDAEYREQMRIGSEARLDQLLSQILGDGEQQPPKPARVASVLTRREQEIALLVAEGLTNQEIAERLVISPRTAEGHVENVLRKLDFRSRSQVAAWIAAAAKPPLKPRPSA